MRHGIRIHGAIALCSLVGVLIGMPYPVWLRFGIVVGSLGYVMCYAAIVLYEMIREGDL